MCASNWNSNNMASHQRARSQEISQTVCNLAGYVRDYILFWDASFECVDGSMDLCTCHMCMVETCWVGNIASYVPLIMFSVLKFCTTITLLVWMNYTRCMLDGIRVLIAKLRFVIRFRCPFRCSANFIAWNHEAWAHQLQWSQIILW